MGDAGLLKELGEKLEAAPLDKSEDLIKIGCVPRSGVLGLFGIKHNDVMEPGMRIHLPVSVTEGKTEKRDDAAPAQKAFENVVNAISRFELITVCANSSQAPAHFSQSLLVAHASPTPGLLPLSSLPLLLKFVLSVLRTPTIALDRIVASLPHPDATKLHLTLHCLNGVRKTYLIACSVEPEVQTLALACSNFSSRLSIRPRDLTRLLSNFQSSLQELTIIATDPTAGHSNVGGRVDEVEGKAIELRSYIDPAKDDCDTRLHTQLWIDLAEEFVEYVHSGDPVDVTFGVKELKAFLTFCEGCEELSVREEQAALDKITGILAGLTTKKSTLVSECVGQLNGKCREEQKHLKLQMSKLQQISDSGIKEVASYAAKVGTQFNEDKSSSAKIKDQMEDVLQQSTAVVAAEPLAGVAKAQCQAHDTKCGGVHIPYPFSIGPGSCAVAGFELDCKNNKPFLGDYEVLNISLQLGQLRVMNKISSFCYNSTTKAMDNTLWEKSLSTPFRLSATARQHVHRHRLSNTGIHR
ncbi:hypothetical protein ABZP36_007054 [Zizania latifolia]